MKSKILAETQFLPLREDYALHFPHLDHAPALFKVVDKNRAYLSKWLEWVEHTQEIKDTEEFTKKSLENNEKGKQLGTTIFKGGKIIGKIGFVELNHKYKNGEIGYWLSADYQGEGIMTQAVKVLMKYGFEELHLNRIVIGAISENWPSRKIPERLGFQLEGIFRENRFYRGQFWDTVIYGKLKREWEEENEK